MPVQPEFIYATLVLPGLFALTLMGEGVAKFLHHQSGWLPLLIGSIFLVIIIGTYFGILRT